MPPVIGAAARRVVVVGVTSFVVPVLFDPGAIPEKFGYHCTQQGGGTAYYCEPMGHATRPAPRPVATPPAADRAALQRAVAALKGALHHAREAAKSGSAEQAAIAKIQTEEAAREITAAIQETSQNGR